MNKVFIIGNICNDPEAFTTQSGVSRSSFKVAVQRRFANSQGVREADFLPVVAWRQTADFCNRYLKKGNKVAVEGSIQVRSYDAQDGTKRHVTEIIAENIEALTRPNNGGEGARNETAQNPEAKPANTMPQGFTEVDADEELPF